MFGEPRADRFSRTVRHEVRLMDREMDEDDQELMAFWYGEDEDSYDPTPEPEPVQDYGHEPYDDFEYELMLRGEPDYNNL